MAVTENLLTQYIGQACRGMDQVSSVTTSWSPFAFRQLKSNHKLSLCLYNILRPACMPWPIRVADTGILRGALRFICFSCPVCVKAVWWADF
jgi:hypothetical protein